MVTKLCIPLAILLAPPVAAQTKDITPGPKELRFHFEKEGVPNPHSFRLHWPDPTANIQAVDVLALDSDVIIQTFDLPQDKVKIIYQDLVKPTGEMRDRIIEADDFNFDGFPDFRIVAQWPYAPQPKKHLIWIFSPKNNAYEFSEDLSNLGAVMVSHRYQKLIVTEMTGSGGGEFIQRWYNVEKSGKPKLSAKMTQIYIDRSLGTFQREIRTRVSGVLQRICKIKFPAEGVPKRVYGSQKDCAPYMAKDTPATKK